MNNEEMTVNKAIEILKEKQSQTNDVKIQNRLDSLICDLGEYFGNSDYVEPEIAKKLNDINTMVFQLDYGWVMSLHEEFIIMKRRLGCRKYLAEHDNKIDGETAQWITTFIQGAIGVISIIFTFLFAYGKIPQNILGILGESQNTDALYYIIGTLGQQIVALIIGIIIGIINRVRRKNKYYSVSDYSFEELLAVKYEGHPKMLKFLSRAATKIANELAIIKANQKKMFSKLDETDKKLDQHAEKQDAGNKKLMEELKSIQSKQNVTEETISKFSEEFNIFLNYYKNLVEQGKISAISQDTFAKINGDTSPTDMISAITDYMGNIKCTDAEISMANQAVNDIVKATNQSGCSEKQKASINKKLVQFKLQAYFASMRNSYDLIYSHKKVSFDDSIEYRRELIAATKSTASDISERLDALESKIIKIFQVPYQECQVKAEKTIEDFKKRVKCSNPDLQTALQEYLSVLRNNFDSIYLHRTKRFYDANESRNNLLLIGGEVKNDITAEQLENFENKLVGLCWPDYNEALKVSESVLKEFKL